MRVAVIGAGIAGLAAAHALRRAAERDRRPLDLVVLEAGERPGGNAATLHDDGFLVETGPHGFLSGAPDTEAMVAELGLEHDVVEVRPAARQRFLVRGGRLHRLPHSPAGWLTTGALSLGGRVRMALEPWVRSEAPPDEESVYDFARRRFGRESAETLADAVVAGTCAGDAAALSMQAAYPAVAAMERSHGSLVRAMIARRRAGVTMPSLRSFTGGMSVLAEALATRLGSSLRLRSEVAGIAPAANGWRVEFANGKADWAERVVLAIPAAGASRVLAASHPELARMAAAPPAAGVAVVALAWRSSDLAHPLEGYGYIVPGSERLLTLGVVWESSLFPDRAPAGWVLVRAMLGGVRAPGTVDLSDPELRHHALTEATNLLGIRRPPRRSWVLRRPHAIAQYTPGHRERLARLRAAAALLPGLEFCGASFDGISFNAAAASGASAARNIWRT